MFGVEIPALPSPAADRAGREAGRGAGRGPSLAGPGQERSEGSSVELPALAQAGSLEQVTQRPLALCLWRLLQRPALGEGCNHSITSITQSIS